MNGLDILTRAVGGHTETVTLPAINMVHLRTAMVVGTKVQALTTPKGVVIEMRVSGSQSSSGVKLKEISTAYLRQGQHLTAANAP